MTPEEGLDALDGLLTTLEDAEPVFRPASKDGPRWMFEEEEIARCRAGLAVVKTTMGEETDQFRITQNVYRMLLEAKRQRNQARDERDALEKENESIRRVLNDLCLAMGNLSEWLKAPEEIDAERLLSSLDDVIGSLHVVLSEKEDKEETS